MSYDIDLCQNGKTVIVDRHEEGGTHVLGGTNYASLNITYNYSRFYYLYLDNEQGICWLYGKTGDAVIDRLEAAIRVLGTERDDDYWSATSGNAGYALSILLKWARQYPQATFEGD